MTKIISHRGLDAEYGHVYTESSREAFTHFLNAGFGLEFDVRITKDGIPVISHDDSLTRIVTSPSVTISDVTATTFSATKLPNGHTITLTEMIDLLHEVKPDATYIHAFHLKHRNQTPAQLDIILPYLSRLIDVPIMIFDIKPEVARDIKRHIPKISLAASVAHPFDIKRYGDVVGHTLLSIEEMNAYADLYEWVWLDEWDRTDNDDQKKALYTEQNFSTLKKLGYNIAVVSPELHATSPKLLGGESHQDAKDKQTLEARFREIIELTPDAICTDYPSTIKRLLL